MCHKQGDVVLLQNTTPLHSAAGADAVALAGLLLVAGADKHAENQAVSLHRWCAVSACNQCS